MYLWNCIITAEIWVQTQSLKGYLLVALKRTLINHFNASSPVLLSMDEMNAGAYADNRPFEIELSVQAVCESERDWCWRRKPPEVGCCFARTNPSSTRSHLPLLYTRNPADWNSRYVGNELSINEKSIASCLCQSYVSVLLLLHWVCLLFYSNTFQRKALPMRRKDSLLLHNSLFCEVQSSKSHHYGL